MPRGVQTAGRVLTAWLIAGSACGLERLLDSEPSSKPPPAEPKKPDAPPPRPEPEPPTPGVAEDGTVVSAVPWFQGTLAQALQQAEEQDKLVFLEVGAYWCPPCHELDEITFVDPEVGEVLEQGYVPLHIDAEKGQGRALVRRYDVQVYPTMLVIEPPGVEKGRIVDFVEPEDLIEKLRRIEQGENVLADLERKVEAEPDNLEARYRLGHAYALAAERKPAEQQFEIVMVGDPKNTLGLASAVLYDRAKFFTAKLDDDYEAAIEQMRDLRKRFPESNEAVRAYRQIGRWLHELDKDQQAVASLEKMVAVDPDDVDLKASYGWFSFRNGVAPDKALQVVESGLQIDPDNPELHYLRAELLALLERPEQALQAIRKASDLEPLSAYYKRQVARFSALADKDDPQ